MRRWTLQRLQRPFQPSVRREQFESLLGLCFVERKENVIFLAPPRVGETHLAISLAIAPAQHGRRACYGTLADLIDSLEEAKAAGRLTHRDRDHWRSLHADPPSERECAGITGRRR